MKWTISGVGAGDDRTVGDQADQTGGSGSAKFPACLAGGGVQIAGHRNRIPVTASTAGRSRSTPPPAQHPPYRCSHARTGRTVAQRWLLDTDSKSCRKNVPNPGHEHLTVGDDSAGPRQNASSRPCLRPGTATTASDSRQS